MKIVCVIPARLKSTRFPKKVLASLAGKPLLQRVWDSARSIPFFSDVVIAVDAQETADLVASFGGRFVMTSPECPSGTDRLVELNAKGTVKGDIWVNWQGDEPFISKKMIEALLQTCGKDKSDVWTLKKRIINLQEVQSIQFAKVVTDAHGYAMYFSRSPIPCYRDFISDDQKNYFKHVGIYAFTQEALIRISKLSPCEIEKAEQLEQLRFLYNGLKVRVHETDEEVTGIDLPEHLAKAEQIIRAKNLT